MDTANQRAQTFLVFCCLIGRWHHVGGSVAELHLKIDKFRSHWDANNIAADIVAGRELFASHRLLGRWSKTGGGILRGSTFQWMSDLHFDEFRDHLGGDKCAKQSLDLRRLIGGRNKACGSG